MKHSVPCTALLTEYRHIDCRSKARIGSSAFGVVEIEVNLGLPSRDDLWLPMRHAYIGR